MDDRPRLELATPPGIAGWVSLKEPNTRHNSDGVYQVDLCYSDPDNNVELQAFTDKITTLAEEGREFFDLKKAYKLRLPIAEETKEDEDGEDRKTGRIRIRTKLNAIRKGRDGKTPRPNHPVVYDSSLNVIPRDQVPNVGAGSKLIVVVAAVPYQMNSEGKKTYGVTLYIQGVQILKLIEFTGVNPLAHLTAADGGYSAEPSLMGADDGEDESDY